MILMSSTCSANVIRLIVQIFEYCLWLVLLSFWHDRLFNYEVLISLQLFAQSSNSMGFTTTVFSLDNNREWLQSLVLLFVFLSEEEVLDLVVNFIDELLIADKWFCILSVVYFFLDNQRIIVKF